VAPARDDLDVTLNSQANIRVGVKPILIRGQYEINR